MLRGQTHAPARHTAGRTHAGWQRSGGVKRQVPPAHTSHAAPMKPGRQWHATPSGVATHSPCPEQSLGQPEQGVSHSRPDQPRSQTHVLFARQEPWPEQLASQRGVLLTIEDVRTSKDGGMGSMSHRRIR